MAAVPPKGTVKRGTGRKRRKFSVEDIEEAPEFTFLQTEVAQVSQHCSADAAFQSALCTPPAA